MTKESNEALFSPILIMEFIRQVTVSRFLDKDNPVEEVKFKLSKAYFDEIMAYPLKAQLIRLDIQYDAANEVLSVKTDDVLLNRFKEQKSLVEIAGKYEGQYADRYKKFIEVLG